MSSEIGEAIIRVRPNASGFMTDMQKAISDGSQGFGKALTGALGTAAKLGATALAGATTAIGAFGAASVKTGAEFDKSMSQVAATMGKTMSEMETEVGSVDLAWGTFSGNLRDYAQEMGKNTAFSATEAADALNYMALAGYDTQTSMEMLPNVLNLAAAGDMELARASDMVTDTQTAFGISLDRTSQMVDEMAKAASTGNTSVEQLGDAFLKVGGLAQELNGGMITLEDGTTATVDGVQELEIALTAMANAGVKGSEAGTHMRNMLLKLSSPTDDGVNQLKALGVSVYDAEGKMRSLSDIFGDLSTSLGNLTQEQKIQAISDLFNVRDVASAEALLNAVGQDWDKIGASILDADGAAQKMADTQLDNLAGDVTLFKSALEGTKIAISDTLTPSLREFVQFGTKGLSDLTSAFQEDGISGAMDKLGEVLSEGLTKVVEFAPEVTDAAIQLLGALGQGLVDNAPIIFDSLMQISGQVTDALLDLMSIAVEGLQQFDWAGTAQEIANWLTESFTGSGMDSFLEMGLSIITNLVTGISEALPELVPAVVDIMLHLTEFLVDHIGDLVDAAIAIITGLTEGLINALPVLIEKAPEIMEKLVQAIIENAPKLAEAALICIQTLGQALMDNFPIIGETMSSLGEIFLKVKDFFQPVIDAAAAFIEYMITAWTTFIGILSNILTSWYEKHKTEITAFVETVKLIVTGWIEALKVGVTNFVDAIATLFKNFFNTVKGIFKAGTELLKGNWKEALNILKTTLSQNIENIMGLFIRMQDRIGNWARGMKDKFLTWGRDMIQNLINGIKEKISAVGDAVSGVADKIREYIHFSEPDVGPLSDFHTYAPDMMKMFAKGISDNTDIVTNAIDRMASDMLSVDASADIRAVAGDTGSRAKSQGGGNIIFNNSFVINGSNKNAKELAEEISYYLEADRQRIAGAYA